MKELTVDQNLNHFSISEMQ